MEKSELNRDIKRLYKNIEKQAENSTVEYYVFLDKVAKPEFIRLHNADSEGKNLNLLSFKIMQRLNQRHRFIPFHSFYLNLEISL